MQSLSVTQYLSICSFALFSHRSLPWHWPAALCSCPDPKAGNRTYTSFVTHYTLRWIHCNRMCCHESNSCMFFEMLTVNAKICSLVKFWSVFHFLCTFIYNCYISTGSGRWSKNYTCHSAETHVGFGATIKGLSVHIREISSKSSYSSG